MTAPRYLATTSRRPLATLIDLRGEPELLARTVAALGLPCPTLPSTFTTIADTKALRLGPERILLLAPLTAEEETLARLHASIADGHGAAVLVSDMYQGFDLEGPDHLDVIRQGAPLDLSPSAFTEGSATGTELWGIGVIVWRETAAGLSILVERSFADYLEHWLLTATGLPSDLRPGVMQSPPPRLRV